ncbi:MAG: hypothetical protein Q8K24_08860 [Hydrogenophaga sp.]|nr:hypothetical protein [Hydrogenophaga sp.]
MRGKLNGGPAFPCDVFDGKTHVIATGLTLRAYAAIKLRVPDSGAEWLDEMIRKSLRDEFAAKAMQAFLTRGANNFIVCTNDAYEMADDMLAAAREGGAQ